TGRPDIAHVEAHIVLLSVSATQDFEWPRDVKQGKSRRKYHVDLYSSHVWPPRYLTQIAGNASIHSTSSATFRARASSTVTIRAKRSSKTSSVRALISSGLQCFPRRSVIGKVNVASVT